MMPRNTNVLDVHVHDQYMCVAKVFIKHCKTLPVRVYVKECTHNDELWSVLLLEAGLGAGVGDRLQRQVATVHLVVIAAAGRFGDVTARVVRARCR